MQSRIAQRLDGCRADRERDAHPLDDDLARDEEPGTPRSTGIRQNDACQHRLRVDGAEWRDVVDATFGPRQTLAGVEHDRLPDGDALIATAWQSAEPVASVFASAQATQVTGPS